MNPMVLVLLSILPLVAFAVGVMLARSGGQQPISKAERKELEAKRNLFHELDIKASEHMAYGDTFATIVSGMLHDHRQKLRKELS